LIYAQNSKLQLFENKFQNFAYPKVNIAEIFVIFENSKSFIWTPKLSISQKVGLVS